MHLNGPKRYREFFGDYAENMSLLHGDLRSPMGVCGLISRRIEVLSSDPEVYDTWWDNFFTTSDAMAFHPDGKVKVVSGRLDGIRLGCKLDDGWLVLEDGGYEGMDGLELTLYKLGKYGINRQLNHSEAVSHPFWKYFARDDELLSLYADILFPRSELLSGAKENMGIFLGSLPEVPSLRPIEVYSAYNKSSMVGTRLDSRTSRLVGIVETKIMSLAG